MTTIEKAVVMFGLDQNAPKVDQFENGIALPVWLDGVAGILLYNLPKSAALNELEDLMSGYFTQAKAMEAIKGSFNTRGYYFKAITLSNQMYSVDDSKLNDNQIVGFACVKHEKCTENQFYQLVNEEIKRINKL